MLNLKNNILAFDVGEKRIGLAIVKKGSFIVKPLDYLNNDHDFNERLKQIIKDNEVDLLVVGLPRNMSGQLTKQTQKVQEFVNQCLKELGLKIVYQDESLTSVVAETNLSFKIKSKGQIDSEAACLILEDYINSL
jgi:putative Holliday junction resolvase